MAKKIEKISLGTAVKSVLRGQSHRAGVSKTSTKIAGAKKLKPLGRFDDKSHIKKGVKPRKGPKPPPTVDRISLV